MLYLIIKVSKNHIHKHCERNYSTRSNLVTTMF